MQTVRIPGDVWSEAKENAKADGEKFADVIELLLRRYNAAAARRRRKQADADPLEVVDDA